MKARWKRAAIIFAVACVPYVGSYTYLSANGRYEVGGYSFGGLIWLAWAPEGFHPKSMRWNNWLLCAYLPLVVLDRRFWHRGIDDGEATNYPVDQDDVQKCRDFINEIKAHYQAK